MGIDAQTIDNIGFVGVLQILFIGLKLATFIDWSWWWVMSPLLIIIIYRLSFIISLAVAVIVTDRKQKKHWNISKRNINENQKRTSKKFC